MNPILIPMHSEDDGLLPMPPDWADTSQYDAESSGYEGRSTTDTA